jgi:hypothetical protein
MEIEVVEFYPMEHDEERGILTGTLRVKLPEIGIDILGIYVSKRKKSWIFSLPGRNGVNHKTGDRCRYPCISFENREKQDALIAALRENGRSFIEKRLADTENPLVIPEKNEKEQKGAKPSLVNNNVARTKETDAIAKPKANPAIAGKQWVDPPAKKMTEKRRRIGRG